MARAPEQERQLPNFLRAPGKQRVFTVGRVTEAEARAKADQVDYLLMRLSQGLLTLPPAVDIVAFVRHDGAIPSNSESSPIQDEPTLADLRDRYLETHGDGTLEAHTLRGINRHFRHLIRLLGEKFPIRKLSMADLQGYIDKRRKAKGRRGTLNPATIKKEIVTLRTAWNWGVRMNIVAGRYPNGGLRYPKSDEKPPFQTRAEIKRQVPGLPPTKVAELWESLYLTLPEIERFLTHVKSKPPTRGYTRWWRLPPIPAPQRRAAQDADRRRGFCRWYHQRSGAEAGAWQKDDATCSSFN